MMKSQSWGESESGYSRSGNVSKQLQFTPKAPRPRTFQSKNNDEVSSDKKTLNLTFQQRRFGAAAANNTATKSNLSQFRKPSLPNSKEKLSPAVRSLDRAARGLNLSSSLDRRRPSLNPRLPVTPSTNTASSGVMRPKLLRQGLFTCLSAVDIFNFNFTYRSQRHRHFQILSRFIFNFSSSEEADPSQGCSMSPLSSGSAAEQI